MKAARATICIDRQPNRIGLVGSRSSNGIAMRLPTVAPRNRLEPNEPISTLFIENYSFSEVAIAGMIPLSIRAVNRAKNNIRKTNLIEKLLPHLVLFCYSLS